MRQDGEPYLSLLGTGPILPYMTFRQMAANGCWYEKIGYDLYMPSCWVCSAHFFVALSECPSSPPYTESNLIFDPGPSVPSITHSVPARATTIPPEKWCIPCIHLSSNPNCPFLSPSVPLVHRHLGLQRKCVHYCFPHVLLVQQMRT